MGKQLTNNEKMVYHFIQTMMPDWVSPTRIGLKVGGKSSNGLQRHSSWASPICKKLIIKGLIQRNGTGQYATIRQGDICYGCPDYTAHCSKVPCGIGQEFILKKNRIANYQPSLSAINEIDTIPDNQTKLLF